jgi:subtilase family serine protease
LAIVLFVATSALAGAGILWASVGPAGTVSLSGAHERVAYTWGPMQSLGFTSETGPAIGGSLDPTAAVPLASTAQVVVTLPLQNTSSLESFILNSTDPNSTAYGQFLTNDQFTALYGAPASAQQLVASYLSSAGLNVSYQSPDHLTVLASGTLSQIASAFNVTLAMYTKGAQTFWAPTASPSAPSNVAPWIFGIAGLTDHNFGYKPQLSVAAVPGTGVMDLPNQMPYVYQLNQLFNATGNKSSGVHPSYAAGVTITQALWSGSPTQCGYSYSDIGITTGGTTQWGYYGNHTGYPSFLPEPVLTPHYNVPGYPGNPPATGQCDTAGVNLSGTAGQIIGTAALELTVDLEYSGQDAPGATLAPTWVNGTSIFETNPPLEALTSWIASGNIPGLAVVTQSYGGGESPATPGSFQAVMDQSFQELAATGVTVLASSGDDNGGTGFEGNGNSFCQSGPAPLTGYGVPGLEYPASAPDVLAVGGTANMAYGAQALPGQTVWNWCPSTDGGISAGSTGGVSLAYPESKWQNLPIVNAAMLNAIQVTETGNYTTGPPPNGCLGCDNGTVYSATSARPVPDVAGPAANNEMYFEQGWVSGYGGTSFSSPATAGALASVIAFTGHRLGLFAPTLYALERAWLKHQVPLAPTYMVQNYSNAFFEGAPGYNTSAGWGVPMAYNLALDLGKPFLATNPHGPGAAGKAYAISAHVQDDKAVSKVQVVYELPGSTTWKSSALKLSSGSSTSGTWTGSIPASAYGGALRYCVMALDRGQGNSWTPWNYSGWEATRGATPNFGCTTPWTVTLSGTPPPAAPTVAASSLGAGVAANALSSGIAAPALVLAPTVRARALPRGAPPDRPRPL